MGKQCMIISKNQFTELRKMKQNLKVLLPILFIYYLGYDHFEILSELLK